MTAVPILSVRREWWCPYCPTMSVTEKAGMHVEFHHCSGMAGLWAPMFQRGERGHLLRVEREDYVGRDKVTTDGKGRPIMRVEKLVGNDQIGVVVYAPSAQHRLRVEQGADLCPKEIRRRGADVMRSWLSRRILARALHRPVRP